MLDIAVVRQIGLADDGGASRDALDAREQLLERKGFYQIIVRAQVER